MGAEYEQITRQLPSEYSQGGEIVRGVVKTLVDAGMLPQALPTVEYDPSVPSFPQDWPKIEFVRVANSDHNVTEMDALDIPTRARNGFRRHNIVELNQLLGLSDEQLLRIRNIGVQTLDQIHAAVQNFRGYVIETRRIAKIQDDLPLQILLPKKPVY
jgi:hypothetical protein